MPRGVPNPKPADVLNPEAEVTAPEPSNVFTLDAEDLADARKLAADYQRQSLAYQDAKAENPKLRRVPPREYDLNQGFRMAAQRKARAQGFLGFTNLRKNEDGSWSAEGLK